MIQYFKKFESRLNKYAFGEITLRQFFMNILFYPVIAVLARIEKVFIAKA